MFPKYRRIPRKMFPLLSGEAQVFRNELFSLKFVLIKDKDSRFCFSVSKKISKSAVVRNRMRRIGYRQLENHLTRIKPKILAIFYFTKIPKNEEDVSKNIGLILKKAKLLK